MFICQSFINFGKNIFSSISRLGGQKPPLKRQVLYFQNQNKLSQQHLRSASSQSLQNNRNSEHQLSNALGKSDTLRP